MVNDRFVMYVINLYLILNLFELESELDFFMFA